jgi:imidazole glycerol-phosphate synthase subunit HisH
VAEVTIVDNGGANLASLCYAMERLGARTQVSADPRVLAGAERVVLPGVGSAVSAMERLQAAGTAAVIARLTQPVLGICLGMQLLFRRSAEGPTDCLGVLADEVYPLSPGRGQPVPHMGWNQLEIRTPDPLLEGVSNHTYMYFVHGYAAAVGGHTLASAQYGSPLAAVVRQRNFWGTQFHPERSGRAGARVLANFLSLARCA